MKVSLFYNEDAGDGIPLKHIRESIREHGHELVHVIERESRVEHVLDPPTQLVVAAGGDGTVAAAAHVLAGRGIPLAILPVGTANNIAKSLGIDGAIDDLIEKWDRSRLQPFDVGIARGPWGTRRFLESVGGGLIPAGIAAAQSHGVDHDEEAAVKVAQAAQTYLDVVSCLEARRCTISLDGTSTMGDFLLVEVLNTPCIGPNLVLSTDASPSDGFFSVVIAAEEHREELCDYLEHVIAGRECDLVLDSHRATRIEIYGRDDIHVDDKLLRSTANDMISLRIEPAALQVLA